MKHNSFHRNSGFTLIEFIVAISIFFLISGASYIPYSHYQKKSLLNQGLKEITQSLQEARNLSINGLDSGSGNLSIGLYLDTSDGNNTSITYFSYPYTFTGSQIIPSQTGEIRIEKEKTLPAGIQVDSIQGHTQFLAVFQSITGDGSYYYWDAPAGTKQPYIESSMDIDISYKGATSTSLQRKITYYTKGYISDY